MNQRLSTDEGRYARMWRVEARDWSRRVAISGALRRGPVVTQEDSPVEILTVGPSGEIELPEKVRERYGIAPASPVRLIETRGGILLVPLSDAPMSAELAEELAQWQALSAEAWEMFPFEEEPESS
jgi:bifunctional DNA-binding transcriptional regulator/antitoxin component of YhaV-PrlF toxin-antitoxin module